MKIGPSSYEFSGVYLKDTATVVGPLEAAGPLSKYFDKTYKDLRLDEKSFEKAEMAMQKDALDILFKKTLELESNIDVIFAGDLINQVVITNYTLRDYNIPFCGLYGACSTSVLGLIMASIVVDGQKAKKVITLTSSHNGASERQFRNPTEYGGAKEPSATFTVTGACSSLVVSQKSKIKIARATMGKIVDVEFTDQFDMGRAMAPAACETILNHMKEFNLKPDYYDLIVTGDLSYFGADIVRQVLEEKFGVVKNYNDCGLMIYDRNKQEVFAGGSGCACCGVVSYGYIKQELEKGNLKKVLICATGALMNSDMTLQKESIPSICHAVALEVE